LVVSFDRRRVVHWNVTSGASAEWTAQRIVEVFPADTAPRYLLRDRDGVYGPAFSKRITGLDIEEVKTARNLLGRIHSWSASWAPFAATASTTSSSSAKATCARSSSRTSRTTTSRTHLSLGKDAPDPRPVQPASAGQIVAFPEVGGLHHRYERRAA
jgi:hypothetical protein